MEIHPANGLETVETNHRYRFNIQFPNPAIGKHREKNKINKDPVFQSIKANCDLGHIQTGTKGPKKKKKNGKNSQFPCSRSNRSTPIDT